ncbi:hypothetical protein B0H13DRAFT_2329651 [Mycena leptocephala]|nr:hypothetical protein B0H13DRAFT_2329651 [Mycena leptocephala]
MTRSRSQLSLVAILLISCNSAQYGSPKMLGSLSQKIVSSCLWRAMASLVQGSHAIALEVLHHLGMHLAQGIHTECSIQLIDRRIELPESKFMAYPRGCTSVAVIHGEDSHDRHCFLYETRKCHKA